MEISGKTAIVTGAASGIGLGIATALAEAGAKPASRWRASKPRLVLRSVPARSRKRLARTGIDPKLVGERVVDAIRNETFYAFVSAVPADVIRARHRRIEAALETSWTTSY